MLKKFQEVETQWIFEVLDIGRLRPIAIQVLKVVDKAAIFEVATLCKKVEVIWICQALHKFQLDLGPRL
jgi:hypothetical protein